MIKRRLQSLFRDVLGFLRSVLGDFANNQGLMVAAAVAFDAMLAILPMLAVIIIGLSQIVDRYPLLETIYRYLRLLARGESGSLVAQAVLYMDNELVVGSVGIVILLFFGYQAFNALENTLVAIFYHRPPLPSPRLRAKVMRPPLFVFLLSLGLFICSISSGGLKTPFHLPVSIYEYSWDMGWLSTTGVYLLGAVGTLLILISVSMVMPMAGVNKRHFKLASVIVLSLWEFSRHILVWVFDALSYINISFGSVAALVTVLLCFYIAVAWVLLCAHVIAEIDRRRQPEIPEQLILL
ncbi:MAG TPA: hypothetical protein ENI80_01360 [Acidiferrobacteraceae bacterium]|nr:hypothetical protein [Acidiferrobacteraceae bacterium]